MGQCRCTGLEEDEGFEVDDVTVVPWQLYHSLIQAASQRRKGQHRIVPGTSGQPVLRLSLLDAPPERLYLPRDTPHGAILTDQGVTGQYAVTVPVEGVHEIRFRRSKNWDDRALRSAEAGLLLLGHDEGDGWVRFDFPGVATPQAAPEQVAAPASSKSLVSTRTGSTCSVQDWSSSANSTYSTPRGADESPWQRGGCSVCSSSDSSAGLRLPIRRRVGR